MKKQLNTAGITNELAGASAFFTRPTPPPPVRPAKTAAAATNQPRTAPAEQPATALGQRADRRSTETTSTALPERPTSKQPHMKASTLARYPDSIIETIRKAVKQAGREVTFVRLTPEEKSQLADIVYTYKRQGVKTSENEISRIAMSYLLENYKANGQESILAKVIAALLA
jgi:hypothetical protein